MHTPVPVCAWPAQQPPAEASCFVLALTLAPTLPRAQARLAVRRAACEALAARLGLAPCVLQTQLEAAPGQAPRFAGLPVGLSFSHEAGLSLVALNLAGAVGVDLLREACPPDWQAVARDYLGPAALARLLTGKGAGFAQAWAAHEARLKLQGLALREWPPSPSLDRQIQSQDLALPDGFAGNVAWADHTG